MRMIAWRVGWVVAPGGLVDDVSRVHIYNGLVPSGFAQVGTRVALACPMNTSQWRTANTSGDATKRCASSTACRRCDLRERGRFSSMSLPSVSTAWSFPTACSRTKVAATPMRGWGGPVADRHVRFVFSNEPVERLALLGDRVRRALLGMRSHDIHEPLQPH